MTTIATQTFTATEGKLVQEAIRRASAWRGNAGVDRALIEEAVVGELARGTRHMYGLVRAASRLAK